MAAFRAMVAVLSVMVALGSAAGGDEGGGGGEGVGDDSDRVQDVVLARVGGVPITESQVAAVGQGAAEAHSLALRRGVLLGLVRRRLALRRGVLLGLVRRRLALTRLMEIGGESLERRIERRLRQRLDSLRRVDPAAELDHAERERLAWDVAWNEYLAKHMTEENLRRFFEARRTRYDGTRLDVSQIFLPHGTADAERQLTELRRRIAGGEMIFADAAREHSAAPSAQDGGRVGWITADGDLPRSVADAAFDTELETVAGPVASTLGWHLVWVAEREPGETDFSAFEDHALLRRDAADFLYERLVREAADSVDVQWVDMSLRPPRGVDIAP